MKEEEEDDDKEDEEEMSIWLQIILKRTLGMTRMLMRFGLLDLLTINPATFFLFIYLFLYM